MRLNPGPDRFQSLPGRDIADQKCTCLNGQRHTGSVTKLHMDVRKRMLLPAVDAYTPVIPD